MNLTLDSLLESKPADERRELRVDVSSFFAKEEGEVVFVYRDPDIKHVFAAANDAQKMRRLYPDWPVALAQSVAVMAISHVEPPSPAPGRVYCELVENHGALATHLMNSFIKAFPHLVNADVEAEAKKNE